MRLADAIVLGSTLRPQTFGPMVDKCGTCAMGAALEAMGLLVMNTEANCQRILKVWPWLTWKVTPPEGGWCPHCGKFLGTISMYSFIVHLNDRDRVSREKIAEVLADMERQARKQIEANIDPNVKELELNQLEAHPNAVEKRKRAKSGQPKHPRNEGLRLPAKTGRRRRAQPATAQ
jgi:hypothetical protein